MKKKLLAGIAVLLLAFLYYYIELPAINIHESGFWFFLVAVIGIIVVVYAIRKRLYGTIQLKQSKGIKAGVILMLVIIAVYAVGSLLFFSNYQCKEISKSCDPGGTGPYRRYPGNQF